MNAGMLYTNLVGFRLLALASRVAAAGDNAVTMHNRLIAAIEEKTADAKRIWDAETNSGVWAIDKPSDPEELGEYEFYRTSFTDAAWERVLAPIDLVDRFEIDHSTREYFLNGEWHSAVFDPTGADYPSPVYLDESELGGLAEIIERLAEETGIAARAYRVEWHPEDQGLAVPAL